MKIINVGKTKRVALVEKGTLVLTQADSLECAAKKKKDASFGVSLLLPCT